MSTAPRERGRSAIESNRISRPSMLKFHLVLIIDPFCFLSRVSLVIVQKSTSAVFVVDNFR